MSFKSGSQAHFADDVLSQWLSQTLPFSASGETRDQINTARITKKVMRVLIIKDMII